MEELKKLEKTEKLKKTKKMKKTLLSDRWPSPLDLSENNGFFSFFSFFNFFSFFSFFSFFGLRMESAVFPRRGPFYLSPAGSRCHCLMAAAPRPDSPEIQYEDDFWECLGREPSC